MKEREHTMKKAYIKPEITIITLEKTELMDIYSGSGIDPNSENSTDDKGAFSKGSTWFDDEDEDE